MYEKGKLFLLEKGWLENMDRKHIFSLLLAANMIGAAVTPAMISAEAITPLAGDAKTVTEIAVYLDTPRCGIEVTDGFTADFDISVDCMAGSETAEDAVTVEKNLFIESLDDAGKPLLFNGKIAGEETYTKYIVLKAQNGYSFDANVKLDEYCADTMQILSGDENMITITAASRSPTGRAMTVPAAESISRRSVRSIRTLISGVTGRSSRMQAPPRRVSGYTPVSSAVRRRMWRCRGCMPRYTSRKPRGRWRPRSHGVPTARRSRRPPVKYVRLRHLYGSMPT